MILTRNEISHNPANANLSLFVPFDNIFSSLLEKLFTFVAQINENDISTILTKIAKIIKLNKERELKEQLFKQTIDKLKQTFEKTDLDKLQHLYFDFETDGPNLELDEQDGQESTTSQLAE